MLLVRIMQLIVRALGCVSYQVAYTAMLDFNRAQTSTQAEECWYMEHPSVYTLGLAADLHHIRDTGQVPVIRTDRGGQVTYHGPGQLVVYWMLRLAAHGLTVRSYVTALEESLIEFLSARKVAAVRKKGAPGVYVGKYKIASLGLRIRRGFSYHGVALNVAMDLAPYEGINPCGLHRQKIIDLRSLGITYSVQETFALLLPYFLRCLRYPADTRVITKTTFVDILL